MTTILLIEDHAPLRRNFRDILELAGYRVIEAETGPEGIDAARQKKPDLILCDIMLPGCDGLEVLATLRSDPLTCVLPLVFLTAKGEPNEIRAGMNLGADDYIPKPVSRADLLAAVRARLERSTQRNARLPDFRDATPLECLGLTPREAEVLLWMAQGKANADIAVIIGCSHATVKKHGLHIFEKLGVETRAAAMLVAIEVLSGR